MKTLDIADQELSELFEEADLPTVIRKQRRKGRFSGPIIEQFINSKKQCVRLKLEELCPGRPVDGVAQTLTSYCRNHPDMPVDIIKADKQVYLVRTSDDVPEKMWSDA